MSDFIEEQHVHEPLKGGLSVLMPKRHAVIIIVSMVGHEFRLKCIYGIHFNLTVT